MFCPPIGAPSGRVEFPTGGEARSESPTAIRFQRIDHTNCTPIIDSAKQMTDGFAEMAATAVLTFAVAKGMCLRHDHTQNIIMSSTTAIMMPTIILSAKKAAVMTAKTTSVP